MSSYSITVVFDNLAEARRFLAGADAAGLPVDVSTVPAPAAEAPQPAKRGRKKAAEAPPAPPAAIEPPPPAAVDTEFDDAPLPPADDWDDAPAPAAATPVVTKDEVRKSLVNYQDRLVAAGNDTETARATVLAMLAKVGGVDKLGMLPESKFAEVVKAAAAAK